MHVCSAANSCRACRPGGGARGLMMTALSKQAQSMHLCVCFGRCQNRFQLLFLACHRQAGKRCSETISRLGRGVVLGGKGREGMCVPLRCQ